MPDTNTNRADVINAIRQELGFRPLSEVEADFGHAPGPQEDVTAALVVQHRLFAGEDWDTAVACLDGALRLMREDALVGIAERRKLLGLPIR